MSGRSSRAMLQPGTPAPAFHLASIDGSSLGLPALLSTGPVVVTFFKISCPVCQFALPFVDRLHRASEASGLQFIAVSQDGADSTRAFLQRFGVSQPVALDASGYPASNAYGISSVPSAFVIETDGTISQSWTGFSKQDLLHLGQRISAEPFEPHESVPEFRPG